jgi:uncharacterized protein (DUF427 family)
MNNAPFLGGHAAECAHIGGRRNRIMVQAVWNGTVIAESDATVVVEGNHYFPLDSVKGDVLRPSDTSSHCPWKGNASY